MASIKIGEVHGLGPARQPTSRDVRCHPIRYRRIKARIDDACGSSLGGEMEKPQELIDLEAQLEEAERVAHDAWVAVMPKQPVLAGQTAIQDPLLEDLERLTDAFRQRDELRRRHADLVDKLT